MLDSQQVGRMLISVSARSPGFSIPPAMKTAPLLTIFLGTFLGLLQPTTAAERELYATDFSEFPVGEDQLAGQNGWTGTNQGQQVHGIDSNVALGIGNTAYLGSNRPDIGTDFVSVSRALSEGAEPATTNVRFETVFGITESLDGGNDVFAFAFFNEQGDFLAAIQFDTTEADYGIWTDDGNELVYTDEAYLAGILHHLRIEIDLESNQWSADLDDIPLFENALFTTTTAERNLGEVAVEWQITDISDPGDNWLLFDDWSLVSLEDTSEIPDERFQITQISIGEDGARHLEWPAVQGISYQVEVSTNGEEWNRDLPDSLITADESSTTLTYIDRTENSEDQRLYRIVWLGTAP